MVYKYCSSSFNPLSLPALRLKSGSKQNLAAFASIFLFRKQAKRSFPIERLLSCVFPMNPLISSYVAGLCPELSNFQEQPENAIHCALFKNGEGISHGFLHSFMFESRGLLKVLLGKVPNKVWIRWEGREVNNSNKSSCSPSWHCDLGAVWELCSDGCDALDFYLPIAWTPTPTIMEFGSFLCLFNLCSRFEG